MTRLMSKRRRRFEAPLVLVLGCGPKLEPPTQPQPAPADVAPPDAMPVDATIAIVDAPPVRTGPPCDPQRHRCNPPLPKLETTPPTFADVKVTYLPEGEELRFVAVVRRPVDVTTSWRGVFVDGDEPIPGTEFVIIETTRSTVTGLIKRRSKLPSQRVLLIDPVDHR